MGTVHSDHQGFTIIEVLVVLTVASALLASVFTLISGRTNKSEFTLAINEITSQISTYYNDSVNGFYDNSANFQCQPNATASNEGGVTFASGGSTAEGAHSGCVFMGRALQFQPVQGGGSKPDPEQYYAYNMVGQQYGPSLPPALATTLREAHVQAFSPNTDSPLTANYPDTKQTVSLRYGLSAVSMCYQTNQNSPCLPTGAVAFLISLSGIGSPTSGTNHVDIYPIRCTTLGQSEQAVVQELDNISDPSSSPNDDTTPIGEQCSGFTAMQPINPSGGVQICFKSGGTHESGLVTIAADGSSTLKRFSSLNCI